MIQKSAPAAIQQVVLLVAVCLSFGFVAPAVAQWQKNGVPATVAVNADQVAPAACGDGQGGLIVTWVDTRNGNSDVYAQHFDAAGNRLWGDSALPVCTDASAQYSPAIVSDGKGGAIVVWRD